MIKVTRVEVLPQPKPDVIITLDNESAKEILAWLGDEDTPVGPVYQLWDTLDDVVNLDYAESIRPRLRGTN